MREFSTIDNLQDLQLLLSLTIVYCFLYFKLYYTFSKIFITFKNSNNIFKKNRILDINIFLICIHLKIHIFTLIFLAKCTSKIEKNAKREVLFIR